MTIEADYEEGKDDTIVVTIKGLNINEKRKHDYILEVRNFKDDSGNKMFRDYVDFEVKRQSI